jgi:hypothetical protein
MNIERLKKRNQYKIMKREREKERKREREKERKRKREKESDIFSAKDDWTQQACRELIVIQAKTILGKF